MIGSRHSDDPFLALSSEKDNILMIYNAEAFVKNDHKAGHFQTTTFYRPASSPFDEIYFCHLEQDKQKFPAIVLFFDT